MKQIRLGLLGASRIAAKVLPSMLKVENLEVAGIAARDETHARVFARENKIQRAYLNYEELISDPGINAVYISVVNSGHEDLIRKSLQAGKHVLCEKTLVLFPKVAKELFDLAAANKLILLEGLMYRHHTQIRKLVSDVFAGKIGKILSIRCSFSFLLYEDKPNRATREAGGGSLNDLGCYIVDFANWLNVGSEIVSVASDFKRNAEIDVSFRSMLEYSNSCRVYLEASTESSSLNLWEVTGIEGSISALRNDPQGLTPSTLIYVNRESETSIEKIEVQDQFQDQFQNFADAIVGKTLPAITAEESIRTAEVMKKIRQSS